MALELLVAGARQPPNKKPPTALGTDSLEPEWPRWLAQVVTAAELVAKRLGKK